MGPTSWNCRHRWCPSSHSSHFIGKIRTKSSKTIPKSSNWRPIFTKKTMEFYTLLAKYRGIRRCRKRPEAVLNNTHVPNIFPRVRCPGAPGGSWWLVVTGRWLDLINGSGWDFIYLHMDLIDLYTGWWFGTWLLWLSIQLGMSSSQLTNSIIFQRGRYTTNQMWMIVEDRDPINDRLFFAINIGWNIDEWR